ncbi:hypothetical protein LEP1GSC050_0973 [Leptospira broomii serovar Hurstbridge str. 5399]|uniref:Outer membrane protein beta-barrel domain-containing protein n=1 Tax=Leptospira broomii serovar Hurstbridge str. 5399 TaxID=1049789 RepID=T0GP03_9LEPT|nr:hypothetical protein [Leptospira broomii]EQA47038.1 hypothetical protein LEP1GSC050_0973 [Leptospira broomii serovar Hurstbridge str. 5399]
MPGSCKDFPNRTKSPLLFKSEMQSNSTSRNFYFLFVGFLLLPTLLYGEDAAIPKFKELPEERPAPPEGNWEFGARFGAGMRGQNRFDHNLNGFSSTLDPRVPSETRERNDRTMTQGEILIRTRFAGNFKVGVLGGFHYFRNFGLTNITGDPFYTRLNFGMESLYFLAMVWQDGRVNRWLNWEAGFGGGYTKALWISRGYATNGKEYFQQDGNLSGTGIEFRLEGSLSTPVTNHISLSAGVFLSWINIASFDGSFNGSSSSIYIRQDGRVTPLTESANQTNILLSQQYSRKLDMQSAYGGIFFGVNYRL